MELNRSEKPVKINATVGNKEVAFNQEVVLAKVFQKSAKEGFELMFRYYYSPLCSNAIRILYDRETAEDIVSDVFVDFWQNRCHTEIRTSYKSYLYQAVRNKSLNYLRGKATKEDLTYTLNEEILDKGFQVTPEDIINYHELTRNLENAIAGLPKQSRRAFQLHRLDGKKYAEIADELKISISAVERLISRALKKLRDTVSDDLSTIALVGWLLS